MSHHDLLEVQSLDIEAEQLNHKKASLSEREQLHREQAEHQKLCALRDEITQSQREAVLRQKRNEDQAQIIAEKIKINEQRLYGGEVKGLRDLQALQEEIKSLRDRQNDFEDEALVAMEEVERFATELNQSNQQNDQFIGRINELTTQVKEFEAEIDDRLGVIASERATLVSELDEGLTFDYDRLRELFGAATVVRFDAGKCVGCPSVMPAVEVDRLKHTTADVATCDECGRIVLL